MIILICENFNKTERKILPQLCFIKMKKHCNKIVFLHEFKSGLMEATE